LPPCASFIASGGKRLTCPGKYAQPGRIAFFAAFEQHLQADADAEKRFGARRLEHRRTQAPGIQLAHAVGHCALAREYHALGLPHEPGIGGNVNLGIRRDVLQRLGYRAQVAHAVVNDGDCITH
jgi:hypothetical protein